MSDDYIKETVSYEIYKCGHCKIEKHSPSGMERHLLIVHNLKVKVI